MFPKLPAPIYITCPKGTSAYLEAEVRLLGLDADVLSDTVVTTEGGIEEIMRLNLMLRTAQRVLLLVAEGRATTPEELYEGVSRLPWEEAIDLSETISITSTVQNETIRDTRYASLKCKDAIVDRIKLKRGRRPDSSASRKSAVVHLHWQADSYAVYIDTSGEPLSRRGYRQLAVEAPMQEALAAALVMATGWPSNGSFVNPMCGSGTIAIEAAMMSAGIPPGALRDDFGFMHIRGLRDQALWKKMRESAMKSGRTRVEKGRIIATDMDSEAVSVARRNAEAAGVGGLIDIKRVEFAKTRMPEGGGVVLLNPPYGKRIGEVEDLEGLYSEIGDFFKKSCARYMGYVFTGNPELSKKIGLRTKRRMQFYNGGIECRLLAYELFKGRMKERET